MSESIPFRRVDLSGHSLAEQLSMARSIIPYGWEVSALPGDPPRIGGSLEYFDIGGATAMQLRNVECRVLRRGEQSETGRLRIRLHTGGRVDGIVDGVHRTLEPGNLTLEGFASDFALECDRFCCNAIALPSLEVKYDPTRHASLTVVDRASPTGRMLTGAMQAFFTMLPKADVREASEAIALMTTLVSQALKVAERDEISASDNRRRQLVAMKTFIEHSLANPELGADMLVAEFPVSRAVAYRLFKDEGGLLRYIQSRRLARAATMLAFADADTPVGEIARQVGLPNTSHFSRLFRERHGMTPSEARRHGTA